MRGQRVVGFLLAGASLWNRSFCYLFSSFSRSCIILFSSAWLAPNEEQEKDGSTQQLAPIYGEPSRRHALYPNYQGIQIPDYS